MVQPVKEIDQTFIQDDHVEEIFHIEEEITSIEEPSDTEKQAFEQIDVQIDSINDKQPEPEISNIYEPDFVEEMSEGPLAGIEGILPSESIVTQYKKPPSYSGNFEITEKQRVFATILENSLKPKSTETKTTEKLSEKAGFIIVALLMMTILVLTLVFSKNNSVSSIHQNSSYSQAFYDVINNIPDNGVVLFAVEYEPAYADELNTPTNLVLDQLIKKNSGIVFLSTIPSGSIIAENILINAKSDPSYNNYINLGYLAGGTASIKSFALNPQKTVPYSLSTPIDSFQPWDSSILENIKHINDFDGIIIATEKFETGRSWIEQINPLLDNSTPMLYIASSQITPLIDAYLDSKQIDALLSGVYEINNYANLSGYTSKTKNYQPAYSVGLIILVISTISGVTIQQLLKQKSRSSLNEE